MTGTDTLSIGTAGWSIAKDCIYRSSYADRIGEIATAMCKIDTAERRCIFDNTARSAATGDALHLIRVVGQAS